LDRREFLWEATGATVGLTVSGKIVASLVREPLDAPSPGDPTQSIFVSTAGDDHNPGTISSPLKTFQAAQSAVREFKKHNPGTISVWFRAGTYYLPKTIVFTPEDSGEAGAPIIYAPYPGEHVVLSGGARLSPRWTAYRDGIMKTSVPAGTSTDQLFVNGQRQMLARYPNYDPNAKYLGGWATDAISPERAKRWADPRGAYIHAIHQYLWGDVHYVITGKSADGNVAYEGGWQNNRPKPMHAQYRFVENVFEEMDAPGEWYLDRANSLLYFYPPAGLDLENAVVEAVRLKHLVEFRGSQESPVKWIELRGFTFQHASRTFMETREPLLRSDWRIYRGGALFFTGAEDCYMDDCFLDQLGGNCIFVSGYNRRIRISRTHIARAGANGISFVGVRKAVRNPLDSYDDRLAIGDLDLTPGPRTTDFPSECLVEDTLIYQTGQVEKQTAPVEIDIARAITVRHCSIYDVPRAGINIGDGCWGGHHIDRCDVFDTVKETGDHGSFNSWGRDRWWGVKDLDLDTVLKGPYAKLPLLDAASTNILSNSRWRCDHGWDIDLDDGSANYHIYNNLCLNGGLKLREGFYRTCENNVLVNNSLHPHVWFNDSHDIFRGNIVFAPYKPIQMRQWTQEIDFNLLHQPAVPQTSPATALQKLSSQDAHSLQGDALFVDEATGDYRVKSNSPALSLGFVNFSMDDFGVQSPKLKAIARQPVMPLKSSDTTPTLSETRSREVAVWAGAKVRNIVGLGEVSAAGSPGETGVILLEVPDTSDAAKAGFFAGDVLLAFNGKPIKELKELLQDTQQNVAGKPASVTILRYQQESTIMIILKP
jgi:hypothetical protein